MNKLIAFFLLMLTAEAHAYVDPGTGSMAVQFIIGGLVAMGFVIKTYYYKIKNFFRSLFGKTPEALPGDASISEANTDSEKESA